jgi:hypothetical protein
MRNKDKDKRDPKPVPSRTEVHAGDETVQSVSYVHSIT